LSDDFQKENLRHTIYDQEKQSNETNKNIVTNNLALLVEGHLDIHAVFQMDPFALVVHRLLAHGAFVKIDRSRDRPVADDTRGSLVDSQHIFVYLLARLDQQLAFLVQFGATLRLSLNTKNKLCNTKQKAHLLVGNKWILVRRGARALRWLRS
jgi:hypothetical protein